jgi:hypothetical protein
MKFEKLRQAFNGSEYLPAKDLVTAAGLKPSRGLEMKLARSLKAEFRIIRHRVRVNGRRVRAYRREDFQADDQGRVRGTLTFIEKQRAKIEREIERLSTRRVLQELTRVAEGLEQDEPNAKERFRRLRSAISYELRMTEKEWAQDNT